MVTQIRTPMVLRICLVAVAALLVAACGPLGDDDDEPTAAVESVETPTTTDLTASTEVSQSTPGPSLPASPEPSDSVATPASEVTPPMTGGTPVAVATPEVSGTPVPADVLSGLVSALDPGSGTPVVGDVTSSNGGPVADANVATSCTLESVPSFPGGAVEFVAIEDLNFRSGPGSDCDLIGEGPLAAGTAVTVTGGPVAREGEEQQWLQVTVDGETGWVAAEFVGSGE